MPRIWIKEVSTNAVIGNRVLGYEILAVGNKSFPLARQTVCNKIPNRLLPAGTYKMVLINTGKNTNT